MGRAHGREVRREASAADSATAGSSPSSSSLRGANGGLGVRACGSFRGAARALPEPARSFRSSRPPSSRPISDVPSERPTSSARCSARSAAGGGQQVRRTLQGAIRGTANAAAGKLGETLAEEHAAAGAISHPAMRRAAEAAAAAGGGGGVRGGVNSADRATVEGAPSALLIGGSGGAGLRIDRPLGVASTHPGLAGPLLLPLPPPRPTPVGDRAEAPPPRPPGPRSPPVSHEDASAALFGGAQFYRLMAEFRHAVLTKTSCPLRRS